MITVRDGPATPDVIVRMIDYGDLLRRLTHDDRLRLSRRKRRRLGIRLLDRIAEAAPTTTEVAASPLLTVPLPPLETVIESIKPIDVDELIGHAAEDVAPHNDHVVAPHNALTHERIDDPIVGERLAHSREARPDHVREAEVAGIKKTDSAPSTTTTAVATSPSSIGLWDQGEAGQDCRDQKPHGYVPP